MKIKIIVPETGIQLVKHVKVHAGDIVDIPYYQAEHLIRLNQAVAAEKVPPVLELALPPTTAEV